MKKLLPIILTVVLCVTAILFAPSCTFNPKEYDRYVESEMKESFDFFWNEAVTNNETTYGLIPDRYPTVNGNASIASVGFGLTAYVIGAEKGYVTREQAHERSLKTLQTLRRLQNTEDVTWNGFFAHFIDMNNGRRRDNCEISTVDTAILLCGALSAGEYFGGEVETLANEVYSAVNWNSMLKTRGSKTYVSMAYNVEQQKVRGVIWDWYAEQLMLYVLGAGSPVEDYRLDDKTYYDFTRKTGSYGTHKFIYSWFGSIFTYQFSHAWIDFSDITDKNGVNWFENSVQASLAAYEYCQDNANNYKAFAQGGWGLTACDTPRGYSGKLGNPPRGWSSSEDANYNKIEGTVAPCGAIGSVVFTPEQSLKALKLYRTDKLLSRCIVDKYGLKDAYNLDSEWFAEDYIGIDKGITLLMLANYQNRAVWNVMMDNEYIQNGLNVLQFTSK